MRGEKFYPQAVTLGLYPCMKQCTVPDLIFKTG